MAELGIKTLRRVAFHRHFSPSIVYVFMNDLWASILFDTCSGWYLIVVLAVRIICIVVLIHLGHHGQPQLSLKTWQGQNTWLNKTVNGQS